MIAGCVGYLDAIGGLGGNNYTYGKNYFTGCIHPISISIRKTLAAASILAHAQLTTPENIQKAKEFLLTTNEIGLYVIHCNVFPEGYSNVDFRDIQVDVNKRNEEELANVKPELSGGIYYRGEGEKGEFDILMGAYRNDFRENARKVLAAFAEDPEVDIPSVAKRLGFSAISVWRAIRAMKEVGLLVREGGDKGGRWIVKKAGC